MLTIAIGDPNNLPAAGRPAQPAEHQRGGRPCWPRRKPIADALAKVYAGQGREHHRHHHRDRERSRARRHAQGRDQHRPGDVDGNGRRGPGPQAHQHGVPAGHPRPGQRHPLRAVRGRVQDALPLRRRAVRNGAAAAPPGHRHLQPHQGHVQPRHRRAPAAAGRPHRAERRRQPGRHARQHPADHVRRERRHPRARPHGGLARPEQARHGRRTCWPSSAS